jgi:hypothetical protein
MLSEARHGKNFRRKPLWPTLLELLHIPLTSQMEHSKTERKLHMKFVQEELKKVVRPFDYLFALGKL